jgi:hypothetical protein
LFRPIFQALQTLRVCLFGLAKRRIPFCVKRNTPVFYFLLFWLLTGMDKYANIIVRTFIRLSTPSLAWGLVTKKGEKKKNRFKY